MTRDWNGHLLVGDQAMVFWYAASQQCELRLAAAHPAPLSFARAGRGGPTTAACRPNQTMRAIRRAKVVEADVIEVMVAPPPPTFSTRRLRPARGSLAGDPRADATGVARFCFIDPQARGAWTRGHPVFDDEDVQPLLARSAPLAPEAAMRAARTVCRRTRFLPRGDSGRNYRAWACADPWLLRRRREATADDDETFNEMERLTAQLDEQMARGPS